MYLSSKRKDGTAVATDATTARFPVVITIILMVYVLKPLAGILHLANRLTSYGSKFTLWCIRTPTMKSVIEYRKLQLFGQLCRLPAQYLSKQTTDEVRNNNDTNDLCTLRQEYFLQKVRRRLQL